MQQKSLYEKIKLNYGMKNLGGNGMFKEMKKRVNNEKGLTLIEVLAVIVIIAIISAIAVPAIGNIVENSRDKAIMTEAINIISGAKIAHMDGTCQASGTVTTPCDEDSLDGDFVEGIPEGAEYSVTLDANNGWTVTYTRFANLNKDYTTVSTSDTTVTETELKNILD